jgi:predicted Zn-dependent peptidase
MSQTAMKNSILLITGLILILSFPLCGTEDSPTKYFKLDNGLQVFLYERHTLPLINLVIAVNVGSKDETEETNGLVHILEHLILFRGTEFRSGSEVSQDIRRHGAYFNAHTDRDLALFEISIPSEYLDFALQNQKEVLFHLKLSQEELDKEKKVILEELSHIQDDPLKHATSLAYQNLFSNHPYQKPIPGRKEIIEGATVDQIESFHQKYFDPSNCALAVVGDFRIEEAEKKVKDVFGPLESRGFTSSELDKVLELEKTIKIEREMDVNQVYLVIGMIGPDYNHPHQYAIDLLTHILGRGVNPLLNIPLRGRRNLVHSANMIYHSLKYGGVILIYLTCDEKYRKAATSETIRFLKRTRRQNYSKNDYYGEERHFRFDYLKSSKNQLKFAFHQSQEKGLSLAISLARFMHLNEEDDRGRFLDNLNKVSSTDLRRAAGEYLSRGKYVIVSILPKKK